MEKEINEPTKYELQEKIRELEHSYAELLADRADVNTLNRIWTEFNYFGQCYLPEVIDGRLRFCP